MKQAQQWERFPEDIKNLIGCKKIRRQSHLKPLTLSFFTSCSIVLRITRAINGFTPNLLIAIKCQKCANWGVVWLLDFLLLSCSGIVKKYSRGKYNGCSRKLQISPCWGDQYLYYVILFSFTDVSVRKNFPCIDFGNSVDSCRQVKLWFVYIVVFYGFSCLCYVLTNQLEVPVYFLVACKSAAAIIRMGNLPW